MAGAGRGHSLIFLNNQSGVRERLINARKQIINNIKEDKKVIDKKSSAQMKKCCNKVAQGSLPWCIPSTNLTYMIRVTQTVRYKKIYKPPINNFLIH